MAIIYLLGKGIVFCSANDQVDIISSSWTKSLPPPVGFRIFHIFVSSILLHFEPSIIWAIFKITLWWHWFDFLTALQPQIESGDKSKSSKSYSAMHISLIYIISTPWCWFYFCCNSYNASLSSWPSWLVVLMVFLIFILDCNWAMIEIYNANSG